MRRKWLVNVYYNDLYLLYIHNGYWRYTVGLSGQWEMVVTVLKSYPQITQLWLKLNKTNPRGRERKSEREGVSVRHRERARE